MQLSGNKAKGFDQIDQGSSLFLYSSSIGEVHVYLKGEMKND